MSLSPGIPVVLDTGRCKLIFTIGIEEWTFGGLWMAFLRLLRVIVKEWA